MLIGQTQQTYQKPLGLQKKKAEVQNDLSRIYSNTSPTQSLQAKSNSCPAVTTIRLYIPLKARRHHAVQMEGK